MHYKKWGNLSIWNMDSPFDNEFPEEDLIEEMEEEGFEGSAEDYYLSKLEHTAMDQLDVLESLKEL